MHRRGMENPGIVHTALWCPCLDVNSGHPSPTVCMAAWPGRARAGVASLVPRPENLVSYPVFPSHRRAYYTTLLRHNDHLGILLKIDPAPPSTRTLDPVSIDLGSVTQHNLRYKRACEVPPSHSQLSRTAVGHAGPILSESVSDVTQARYGRSQHASHTSNPCATPLEITLTSFAVAWL